MDEHTLVKIALPLVGDVWQGQVPVIVWQMSQLTASFLGLAGISLMVDFWDWIRESK